MIDNRKNVKVHPSVRAQLDSMKNILEMKSDSETIDYLINAYELMKAKLSYVDHRDLVSVVKHDHRQGAF